mgnify:CR=1 FL=1
MVFNEWVDSLFSTLFVSGCLAFEIIQKKWSVSFKVIKCYFFEEMEIQKFFLVEFSKNEIFEKFGMINTTTIIIVKN